MAENYYDDLIREIKKNIELECYDLASEMIEDELAMPYVPSKVLQQLESLRKEIKPFLVKSKPMTVLDEQQVREYLVSDGEKPYQALRFLKNANIRNYLEVIQDYLFDKSADRMIVSLLIELCSEQGVREALSYWHNGERQIVIPAEVTEIYKEEQFTECWYRLEEILGSKNPSFLNICRQVLVQFAHLHYPRKPEFDTDLLACSIIAYVYKAYGDEEGLNEFLKANDLTLEKLVEIVI